MMHIIRQQYFHVEVNGTESDGLALQRSLPDLCEHSLTPALERVLDRCVPATEHLSLERLEIDVGVMALERMEHDLAAAVTSAIEKSLQELLRSEAAATTNISGSVRRTTNQQSLHEALLYFLQTGSLPWSFRLLVGQSFEQVLLQAWEEETHAITALPANNRAILEALFFASVRQRLVRQFSVSFLAVLLRHLAPDAEKTRSEIIQLLQNSAVSTGDLKYFDRQLWETILQQVAWRRIFSATELIRATWQALPEQQTPRPALERMIENYWPGTTATEDTPESVVIDFPAPEKSPRQFIDQQELTEGLYVDCAGLVLLHPFLPQFFSGLGLATKDKLLQPDRALCLLHFLATGQIVAPEYELVLPKILCNVPLETPVEANVALTVAEQEEATALLDAVIRHWEVLHNTGADSLRGTFLIRPGKVSLRKDGDWLLQVEANSFDILLDQLPWGIGMIKLPWMEKMLWVEWR